MIKKIINKYFESFAYFYSFLGYRIFIIIALSIFIGVLDGFGLTMFLPLLQMVSDSGAVDPEDLGRLSFLIDFFNYVGIPLSLMSILCLMLFFFFGKGIMQYIAGIYNVYVREWFIKKLRIQNIKGLNNLAYKYFVMSDVGRIQNTLTGEVDRVAASYFNYFKAFEYGILVVVYMGFAFTINAEFAVLVSVGGILTNFLYTKLYKNTKGISRSLTGENNVFQSLIIQNVANFKYLKATGSLNKYGEKLEDSVLKIQESNKKIGKLDALLTAGREPILISVVVLVIFIQTSFLGSALGPILISLLFFYRALNYLMQMQARWNKFLAVSGSLENMTAFGKELRANQEITGDIDFIQPIETMELSNVSFYYNQTPILKDISLKINKKETIAFVGESGSGKTTLVNIIAGLLPIDSGGLRLNNLNSLDINLDDLQKKIGYITQDPVIFNDTLYNNVSFWADQNKFNKDKFWEAVKRAAIFDYINDLPEKENTILGNNGVNLSGGQRQRISIARELFKDVEILILDEATSALDSETEKAIQHNIDQLKGDYTILIVAHRISTIKNADRIVVMKNGEISNIGGFYELIDQSPYFKKLVELQEV
ncbi:ABC-type multidrug transport system, ATPase and permease component [Salegentibacter holothuriorum]|uniref:ABC-type multidrug transport system, ATPase and permease component n=1 Tax=Salegentibacter holothuriorum TaxID=241145 RepID=A0A1T5AQH0_9FLAO|nr:ABC transporter ATP-binding protein [Salegentibacter holothuriorum]SKB37050.1 ABC-type multidrug transport system, ATPase and permease component [Salegentibacter holothuriorum]